MNGLSEQLQAAYAGKSVLVTGHTGFKGGWLALWLQALGAKVTGFSLPPTSSSLFEAAAIGTTCTSLLGDLRDLAALEQALRRSQPQVIFHLAAQALVRASYQAPLETISTNILGTAHLLEAVRRSGRPCAVVIVTSDKCYENREWLAAYREEDPMGGHDVYSMSKGAAELVTSSYRRSFFPPQRLASHGVALASARAGNVIGGGDWSKDRLVPDALDAIAAGRPVAVRSPRAVRPWQHVLEPLGGYLLLGARLQGADAVRHCDAFNFGPRVEDAREVRAVVEALIAAWGSGSWEDCSDPTAPHEAGLLRLAIDKAHALLGWSPRWSFDQAIVRTAEWYRAQRAGGSPEELRRLCLAQIAAYSGEAGPPR